jgi:2'-5' RNA ligase
VSEERARLFVALELPLEVRQALASWRSRATVGITGLRPLPDDHLHVTLCFLGWLPTDEIQAVGQACRQLSPGDPPGLSLGHVLWLPPRRPRVLAVGLSDTGGRLTEIQGELSALLEAGGWYEPEPRPYLPHITAARAGRRERIAGSLLPVPPPLSFTAARVTLFRSRLNRAGARYEALCSVSLVSTA